MSKTDEIAEKVNQERELAKAAPGPVELQSLPCRKYLDETVVPLLLEGLHHLSRCKYAQFKQNKQNSFLFRSGLRQRPMRSNGWLHFC